MLKNNKTRMIAFLLLANILVVTSITAQAASLQDAVEVSNVEMVEEVSSETVDSETTTEQTVQTVCAASAVAETIVPEVKETVAELEEQKAKEELLAQYDLELLASIIFCEAGNQSYEGQVAVGAVIMNRIKSERFPNTMEEVIYQSGQFTPAITGWLDSVRSLAGYTESAMQAAKDAVLGSNPVGDSLFFDQGGYGYQIGAHYFH